MSGCEQRGPRGIVVTVAWIVSVVMAGIAVSRCGSEAHARDEVPPPPVIDAVRDHGELRPRVRTTPTGVSDRTPVDGPMCGGELDLAELEAPSQLGVLLQEPATERERALVERSYRACESMRGPVRLAADPFLVLALARLEEELGAPASLFVGAYCVEVSMKARSKHDDGRFRGDWRNGRALALGPFQLHEGVWSGVCGGTPDAPHDLLWAAGCYWQNVTRVLESGKVSHCRPRDRLRVAEAAASNVRRYGLRCDSRSAHWRVMEGIR